MTPYYQNEYITLFHANCLDVLSGYRDNEFDVAIPDPPYGLNITRRKEIGQSGKSAVPATDYGEEDWDKETPPAEYFQELLRISRQQAIFGGNYFTNHLPVSKGWIVWDKENGSTSYSDCELVWTSFLSSVRIFRYRWNGMLQGKIQNMKLTEKRYHRCQKPLPLMEWIVANHTKKTDLLIDTHAGSGTLGVAAIYFKRKAVLIENMERHCEIAAKRCEEAASLIIPDEFIA